MLGPEWGVPLVVCGLAGLVLYFILWKDKNPPWLKRGLIGILVLFLLTSGSVLAWKLESPLPTISALVQWPIPPTPRELEAEYLLAREDYDRAHQTFVAVAPKQASDIANSGTISGDATVAGPVTVQPGGAASFGQQGGVTAGTYVNNPPVNHYAPVVTYERNGFKHEQSGNNFTATAGEAFQAFQDMVRLFQSQQWQALISTATFDMTNFPEWITPYEFAAYGYGNLGQVQKAITMLREVESRAGGNAEYNQAVEVLRRLEAMPPK